MSAPNDRTEARALIAELLGRMAGWIPGQGEPPVMDLSSVPPGVLAIVNEVTGEGEVSIRLAGADDVRIQETVFAGLWRVCRFGAAGRLVQDWLEAGSIPRGVLRAAARGAQATLAMPDPAGLPEGVMNAPALLQEIAAQMSAWRSGVRAHVVNLTLLPLSAQDHVLLERALPRGPVSIMSRGFGNCRISSTVARHVWRVQYFNNLQALILDTIEIVDVPEVALAAPEDIAESRERLAELIEWMGEPAEVQS